MKLPFSLSLFTTKWHIPLFTRVSTFIRTLSPGDRFIASVLGIFVVSTSLVGLYQLERSLLVVQPAYGGSLTEGVVGAPRFVNPLLALTDTDRDLSTLTYAGLMGVAPTSESGLTPVLAQSYTVSSDGKTYTFTLREQATFSDGTPVTADDVVFTVQKAQDPLLKSPVQSDWANIRVEAIDSRTVRFTLPKAYTPFLENTTLGILPAHIWKPLSDQDFPFATYETEPVGAGPFTFSKLTRDSRGDITSYKLTANKSYALGRPYLDGFTFKFFSDTTTLTRTLTSGTIDSAYGVARPGALTAPYARIFGVFFNSAQNAALGDLAARHALSVAIDRTHIVKDLLSGYSSASYGPVPAGSGIVSTSTDPDTSARTETAKEILTSGGWKFDETAGSWSKDGNTLSITLKTANIPELKTIASAIQADWKKLGVPVSLELSDPASLTQQVIAPRTFGALFFGEVVGRADDLYAFWDSSERASPGLDIANYTSKPVDTLLEKIRTSDSPDEKRADLQKVNDLIAADYPAAFTHTPDFLYSVPKSLHGVQLVQIASPSDRFAAVNTWYRRSEAVWPFLARSN